MAACHWRARSKWRGKGPLLRRIGLAGRGCIACCAGRRGRGLRGSRCRLRALRKRNLRTDLRLRPDPASTAPAISTQYATGYYESIGQNWERMAHIKARVCARWRRREVRVNR